MSGGPPKEMLRRLPKVDKLAKGLKGPASVVNAAARQIVDETRAQILAGALSEVPDLTLAAQRRASELRDGRLRTVINASGVVVHTNLGRAPWSESAIRAAARVARYCDLEMDLHSGRRGGRLRGVKALLAELCGAEDAIVVNNCAAAVLLGVTALAHGREVLVSRGELVEIGGSFRVPDVIASGGTRLREVGTTNRTRAADFAAGVGDDTGAILRVHPSNFRIVGFTEEPDRAELVAVGRAHGVVVLEDLGSGSLDGAMGETAVGEALQAGIDAVFFSGDKLLGGPQAGIVAGRAEVVQRMRRHPLYRALRVDKVVLAALEATLGDHLAGEIPPVLAMVYATEEALRARAEGMAAALVAAGLQPSVLQDVGYVGGGALPGQGLPGWAVRLDVADADAVALALRTGDPAVVARVFRGGIQLDPRTVAEGEVQPLVERVAEVLTTP